MIDACMVGTRYVRTEIEMNIIVHLDIKLSIPNGDGGGEIEAGLGGELVVALHVV